MYENYIIAKLPFLCTLFDSNFEHVEYSVILFDCGRLTLDLP